MQGLGQVEGLPDMKAEKGPALGEEGGVPVRQCCGKAAGPFEAL